MIREDVRNSSLIILRISHSDLLMKIPLNCTKESGKIFQSNYETITHGQGKLMLMAGDQKIEHLNNDFYGPGITPDDASLD